MRVLDRPALPGDKVIIKRGPPYIYAEPRVFEGETGTALGNDGRFVTVRFDGHPWHIIPYHVTSCKVIEL